VRADTSQHSEEDTIMFRNSFAARRPRRAPCPYFPPRLEALEDRLTPSGYSLTDLGGPPSGFISISVTGINNSGQIVADASTTTNIDHAFLYSNGQWTDLGVPSGFTNSQATGINDFGQIVGDAYNTNSAGIIVADHVVLYSNGQWTDLGVPSGFDTIQFAGINNSGQIIADASHSSGGADHAVLYSNGQWTDLGVPSGFGNSEPFAINDSGQIVGVALPSMGSYVNHAVLYSNGQWTDLGVPGGFTGSDAFTINNFGQIVGDASDAAGTSGDAFLYSNGQSTDLNSVLRAGTTITLSSADAINDNGQIVATGSDFHLYLLTPQTGATTQQATTTSLRVSATNVPPGQAVTLTATVVNTTNNANTPPGSVTFFDGSTAQRTVTLTNGTASLTTTLPSGGHRISATYNGFTQGGTVFNSSPSNTLTVTVSGPGGVSPPAPVDQVAADASMLVQGLESGNFNLALQSVLDFLAILNSNPPAQQQQLLLAFYEDFFTDLSGPLPQ
jgi:probable HAF family extracellular repeat protein